MLHWPQYCSPSLRTNQVGTTIERNLGESEIQQFGQVFLWFRSIRSTGWFQRDRASKTTRVSIYSWNIYLSLFVYPSMCLFISLGPSKYPEKWRFTWDNSSTLTIVGLGLYIHTHLTSAKGLSPSCGRILKPFPAGVFYMVHPGDSQGQRRLSQIKIKDWLFDLCLVGGLEHDFFDFPIQLIQLIVGKNHPNWRTQIFQRGRYTTNQLFDLCSSGIWRQQWFDGNTGFIPTSTDPSLWSLYESHVVLLEGW